MTPAALASSLWDAADSHPTEATACSFAFFLGLNACAGRLARPHAPTLFGSRGGGQQGGRGRPHGDELLGVFVNHTVTLVHVALAVCGVWHMFVREQGLEVLSRDPLHGRLPTTAVLYPLSLGYLLYDTLDLFRTYRSTARSSPPQWILLHHLALLTGVAFSCGLGLRDASSGEAPGLFRPSECAAAPLIMLLFAHELNSFFMLGRAWLRLLGCDSVGSASLRRGWRRLGTQIYRANLCGFWVSFVGARLWTSGRGVAVSLSLWEEEPWLSAVGSGFGALFFVMNLGAGWIVWKREREDSSQKQRRQPTRSSERRRRSRSPSPSPSPSHDRSPRLRSGRGRLSAKRPPVLALLLHLAAAHTCAALSPLFQADGSVEEDPKAAAAATALGGFWGPWEPDRGALKLDDEAAAAMAASGSAFGPVGRFASEVLAGIADSRPGLQRSKDLPLLSAEVACAAAFVLYGPLNYGTAARTLFLRPYLAHFCPVFSRFFAVFSVLTPGFQKVAPKDRGPVPKTAEERVVAAELFLMDRYPAAVLALRWAVSHSAHSADAAWLRWLGALHNGALGVFSLLMWLAVIAGLAVESPWGSALEFFCLPTGEPLMPPRLALLPYFFYTWYWATSNQPWVLGGVFLNTFVHTFMYYYYCVSLFGVKPWWKKHLTKLQISQFAMGAPCASLYLHYHLLGPGCTEVDTTVATGCFDVSLICLFAQFYRKAYRNRGGTKQS